MEDKKKGMTRALSTALKMEKDGMAFYEETSKNIKNQLGKKMFLSFVEDEKRHYGMIEALANGLNIGKELKKAGPAERIRTIFEKAKKDIDARLGSDPSDVEALKFACRMEDKGYEFYRDSAASASDAGEKALFEKLAREESRHHEILENALTYLEKSGEWFLWEEGGPIEGG
ncbi:MAG: ferritin family protein [bacterium]